ncbi:MAG: UvrD-helicase domain-containing protein [Opitutales bacterium]
MNAPQQFQHEMLLANAGSGKTFALTTRIIRLLLAGVPADRIAALTFTRKSAGEFLDELLVRLAKAASDDKKLRELATATAQPDLSPSDCSRLLRHIVEHFGRLGLGTIDSFFARIARQFPLESGLPEDFAIADTASLASARERALAASFSRSTRDNEGLTAMIEQCRQISRRQGERDVFGTLLRQIESLHQRYLETPPGCVWGDAHAIWAEPPFAGATDLGTAIDHFQQAVLSAKPDLTDEALENLHDGLDALRALDPGQAWSLEVQKFVEQKLSSAPKNNHIRFAPKKADGWVELTADVQATRQRLLHSLYADALQQILERSQGLYQFVREYESVYADLVRGAGLISFADITTLLAERADDAHTLDALDWRSQVAYRIDQRFDHWLLDEFQDTSRTQWTILRAFIEEVVMDEAARRSFFYVGDTKQAIYGWRGGEAELFREIFDYYDSIEEAPPLTDSWRSTQPVIDLVNQVFGQVEIVADELKLPEATVAKWQLGWNEHHVAEPIRGRKGYATWRAVENDPESEHPAQHEAVLQILEEVDPLSHGIECAVLLRKNDDVAELAAFLQARSIPVAVEGKANPCTDNLLGSAVLAALRAVAHPDDSLAAAIARGLPCAPAWGIKDLDTFRERSLQSIAENGFAQTIQYWIDLAALKAGSHAPMPPHNDTAIPPQTTSSSSHPSSLIPHPSSFIPHPSSLTPHPSSFIPHPSSFIPHPSSLPPHPSPEPFLQERAETLLATAEAFDAKSAHGEGIDAFIAHIESLEIQEAESTDAIRIMTVHQAKGLGFDMVIVGGLDKPGRSGSADELVLGPDKQAPHWGLLMPRKDIAEQDPLLRSLNERITAEAKTNELCGAYVALTRPKQALYVLSDALDEKSKASHFGKHLQLTLEEYWQAGDPNWYQT